MGPAGGGLKPERPFPGGAVGGNARREVVYPGIYGFGAFLVLFPLFAPPGFAQERVGADEFARIAVRKRRARTRLLVERKPPVLPERYLPLENEPASAFRPIPGMRTAGDLQAALEEERARMAPFVRNLAPPVEETRIRRYFRTFLWREETPADRRNFAALLKGEGPWKEVSIPHYGPPLGRARTYYFRKFRVTREMLAKGALFLCFKGVDYKARVFVNGFPAGAHEGFFAPFECWVTPYVREGENDLLVQVENDFTTTSAKGDKIYAATGPGYDDPKEGWHHCPAGMGIYQDCWVEARPPLHVLDVFPRPLPGKRKVQVRLEVGNRSGAGRKVSFRFSIYGRNFRETVLEDFSWEPRTVVVPGVGDLAKPTDWEERTLKMGYGPNFLSLELPVPKPRLWSPEHPWLYQLEVRLYDEKGRLADARSVPFGMRTFEMDAEGNPKGWFYLNGAKIRLRGANTMGAFQRDVMRKDWNRLEDDILLARVCRLNYLRLTQRPVQPEIYHWCDMLGVMTQTDLPLFGVLRPNQWPQAVKQAWEMERLVRAHPCNIVDTYINERFPGGEGNPQRSMSAPAEYDALFAACDKAVWMANPDRVTKPCDGDYDPPAPGLPDNHCYNGWYNGHGLPLGKLYKGYWQPVKPGWLYGCGEFGAEGLDNLTTMKERYPISWLPSRPAEEASWTPARIPAAQTWRFHWMWFGTQHSLEDWIRASQEHQAWAVRFAAEAFRRDPRMVSFAVHLFIDAWPAGWMKAILDVERRPKKAFFAYRDALAPFLVSLRADRRRFFSGDRGKVEVWVCNDTNRVPKGWSLHYQLEEGKKVLLSHRVSPRILPVAPSFQGFLAFQAPAVEKRTTFTWRAALFDEKGEGLSESVLELEVFPKPRKPETSAWCAGEKRGKAARLAAEAGLESVGDPAAAGALLVYGIKDYLKEKARLDALVRRGKVLLLLDVPPGEWEIGGSRVRVERTSMGSYYFASAATGHPLVSWARPRDFRLWYDPAKDYVTPFLDEVFRGRGWKPILESGNPNWKGDEGALMAAGELPLGEGVIRICQVQLGGRLGVNPVARRFFLALLKH